MSQDSPPLKKQDLVTLVGGIVHDTSTLLQQQIDLLRADLLSEARRMGGGAASIAAGGGLMAAGGLLSGMMVAHALQRATRLPLWACYGLIGGGLGATGLSLMRRGVEDIASVQLLPPPETAAALQENAAWMKEQITG
jgi:hypothetical protein